LEELNKLCTGFFIVDHVVLRKKGSFEWTLLLHDNQEEIILENSGDADYKSLELLSFSVLLLGSNPLNLKMFKIGR
jgi:hypothetical protein